MSLMKNLLKRVGKFLAISVLAAAASIPAMAANSVYISQSGTGAQTGVDCSNAKPVTYFNTSGNWSATPTGIQIGPDTHVFACGTFTGTAGANMLTVQGGGTSGHPVLIDVTGTTFTAPYWNTSGGAIGCSGFNYITVDGGGTAIIKNTANGTGLAYQQDSSGVDFEFCDNGEVRGLNIQNIYVHTGTGSVEGGHGIRYQYIPFVASIHGNSVVYAENCFDINYTGGTAISVYNNTADYCKWGLAIGNESSSYSASGVNVYGNVFGPHFDAMLDSAQTFHGDGIIIASTSPGVMSNSNFYDNYVHGDLSADPTLNSTAYLFFTGVFTNVNVFNNVVGQDTLNTGAGGPEGIIRIGGTGDASNTFSGRFVNNTIYGAYNGSGYAPSAFKNDHEAITSENNVIYNIGAVYIDNTSGSFNLTSNNNVFYNITGYIASALGGIYYNTLANWQAATSNDASPPTTQSNPLIYSGAPPYYPTSGSSAVAGVNLTSLSITALNSDAPYTFGTGYACGSGCTARPSSGTNNWPMGAYQVYGSSPNPPTGVSSSNGGSVGAHTVAVTWNPSTGSGLTYYIFRGFSSGGEGSTPINSSGVGLNCTGPSGGCSYTDSTVLAGMNLYYFVESYNGSYSSPSNETNSQVPVVAPTGLTIISTH